jgi:hypothetical protein
MVVLFIFSWRATAVLKFLNQIASAKIMIGTAIVQK